MEEMQRCQKMKTSEGKCISIEKTGEFAATVKKALLCISEAHLPVAG